MVYVCNKHGVGNIKRFVNEFVSRPLPLLRRSFISFHQLCGNQNPSTSGGPFACAITVEKDQHQEEEHIAGPQRQDRSVLVTVPGSSLRNDGDVQNLSEWFFEYHQLPHIGMNQRLVLKAVFDAKDGGFGADNIHIHTPQR